MSKRRVIVAHASGEHAAELIEAMRKAGYKLDHVTSVDHMVHVEFKPRKK